MDVRFVGAGYPFRRSARATPTAGLGGCGRGGADAGGTGGAPVGSRRLCGHGGQRPLRWVVHEWQRRHIDAEGWRYQSWRREQCGRALPSDYCCDAGLSGRKLFRTGRSHRIRSTITTQAGASAANYGAGATGGVNAASGPVGRGGRAWRAGLLPGRRVSMSAT
jgi:hypothetical protein